MKKLVAGLFLVGLAVMSTTNNVNNVEAEKFEVSIVSSEAEPITSPSYMNIGVIEKVQKQIGYISVGSVAVKAFKQDIAPTVEVVSYNDSIDYVVDADSSWLKVYKGDYEIGYIEAEYVSPTKDEGRAVSMPNHKNFKSYMPYTALSSKSSKQYALQGIATTGFGGIRTVNDRYCIAVGTALDCEVGQYITLVQENGVELDCIVGDIKDNRDTESNNIVTSANGCVSEFIVDQSNMDMTAKKLGSMNGLGDDWDSKVIEIVVWDYVEEL